MAIKYTVKLDLTDNGCINTGWRIKQGDYNNSIIVVKIVNNNEVVYDPDNVPTIAFKRIDGKSVVGSMVPSENESYQYLLIGSELAVAGQVIMDVKFSDNGRASTASCKFECVEDTIGAESTPAGIYENSVTLDKIIQANSEAFSARDEAVEAARIAVETVGSGIATSSNVGLVKPDNVTTFVDANGVMSAVGGGGGGGGSVVSVDPKLSSGVNVADIYVNGAKSSIYAPEQVVQNWETLSGKPFKTIGNHLTVDTNGNLNGEEGGAKTWNELDNKPFNSIGNNLSVTGGVLSANVQDKNWNDVKNKPFTSIGNHLSVDEDGKLNGEEGGAKTWSELGDKPFTTIGTNLSVDTDGNLNANAGSVVSVNQVLATGTKIAEISVDGNKTDLFAPKGGGGGASAAVDVSFDEKQTGLGNNVQVAIEGLNTKTDAINENLTPKSQTLRSGETTINFVDDNLLAENAYVEFWADIEHKDLMPSGMSVSGNTLTATYNAQSEDAVVGMSVRV